MKAISLSPGACSFFLLPIALLDDKNAKKDSWTVGDNPCSSLYSFAFLILLRLLPHVECFSVALYFFRGLSKKKDLTCDYLLSMLSFHYRIEHFGGYKIFNLLCRNISCFFRVLKVIEQQVFKKLMFFSVIIKNFFALLPKAPFGQIVVHDV